MSKILLCSEFYLPHIGGVEIHTKTLFNYFNKKKSEVFIATSYDSKRKNFSKKNIQEFKIKGNLVKGYRGETTNYQNFLLNNNFDIIFFNAAQQWSFDLALPILENIKAKKILFPCGFSRYKNYLYKPYFEIIKQKINLIDKIICANKKSFDYLYLKKIYKKKIFIINNGASRIKPKSKNYNLLKDCLINSKYKNYKLFINISNIKFNKGQDRVISLFKKIPLKNLLLILVGDNHSSLYYIYIKFKILLFNYYNKSKKIFLLKSNKDLVNELYRESDYFIFGSRLEYDPLVMYESIISNTKFLAYKVGTCHDIMEKTNYGISSDNDNEKIEFILKNIKKKSVNKNIEKYTWPIICKKYSKIFFSSK